MLTKEYFREERDQKDQHGNGGKDHPLPRRSSQDQNLARTWVFWVPRCSLLVTQHGQGGSWAKASTLNASCHSCLIFMEQQAALGHSSPRRTSSKQSIHSAPRQSSTWFSPGICELRCHSSLRIRTEGRLWPAAFASSLSWCTSWGFVFSQIYPVIRMCHALSAGSGCNTTQLHRLAEFTQ